MPTRLQLRKAAAKELGPFDSGTADSTSSTSALVCLTHPFKSSISSGTFKDRWLYRPDAAAAADKLRVVSAYTASTGTLTPELDWSAQPDGEAFEVHGILPPEGNSELSLHDLIHEALKHCFLVVEFTLTPTVLQTRHSLASAASWLSDPSWVRQVGFLTSSESRDKVNPFERVVRGRAVKDTNTVYLEHRSTTFNSSDVVYVKAIKPAYYACAAAASPTTFTQSGLNAEADVAIPNEEWVASAVLVLAWRRLGKTLEAGARENHIKNRAEAAAWFSTQSRTHFSLPPLTFVERGGLFGPSRR